MPWKDFDKEDEATIAEAEKASKLAYEAATNSGLPATQIHNAAASAIGTVCAQRLMRRSL